MKRMVMVLLLLFVAVAVFAQGLDVDHFVGKYEAIFGGLVLVWGEIAKMFGLKKKVKSFYFVVLAGAIVIGGIFMTMGWADGIGMAMSFAVATNLVDGFRGAKKGVKANPTPRIYQ